MKISVFKIKVWRLIIKWRQHFFISKPIKMDFLEQYVEKYLEVVNLDGDSDLENTNKAQLLGFARSAGLAQKIQALSDSGDAEIAAKTSALTDLAIKFNRAFPDLTDGEKEQVETIVAGIVTGDNQVDAEEWFNATLDGIQFGQRYAKVANALLASVAPAGSRR